MNLKNIKHAKGTGASIATTNDQAALCSPEDAYNYMMTMLQILAAFFLFCYMTTCNYLNALLINTDNDYPIGATLERIIQKTGENPYGNRFLKCNPTEVASSDKVPKIKWWWQQTQETSYHLGGWVLHNYFDFSKNKFIGPTEIPDTGILSFIRWMLFGAWTQLSMLIMLGAVFLTCIPGWFGGLFAFMSIKGDGWNKFVLFCLSAALTLVFGLVSVFPIFYEFIYLIYLFFFKRFISNPDDVSDEFTKRMSHLIVVFVIVALIVAAIQLPPVTAGALAFIVAAVSMISYWITRPSGNKAAASAGTLEAVGAVVDAAANAANPNGYMPVSQKDD
jgi:hypothetical protein